MRILLAVVVAFFSLTAFADSDKAAIVYNSDEDWCTLTTGEGVFQSDTIKLRGQYAGGNAGMPSNGSLHCSGTHDIDLEKTIVLNDGFCSYNGILTDKVGGSLNKGGQWTFHCNFYRAPKDYQP